MVNDFHQNITASHFCAAAGMYPARSLLRRSLLFGLWYILRPIDK